jgi:hypothetical protein
LVARRALGVRVAGEPAGDHLVAALDPLGVRIEAVADVLAEELADVVRVVRLPGREIAVQPVLSARVIHGFTVRRSVAGVSR